MKNEDLFSGLMQRLGGDPAAGTVPSAAGRTLDSLRRRIIALDLPPDTVLSRAALAQEYDVSQTPLRDALQKLESEGLVEIFPQSKTVVTRIDADKIHEALFLRRAIELEVVHVLAPVIDKATITRLRTIIGMQDALAEQRDEIGTFQELDESFHQVMLAAVGFPELHQLIRARSGHLNRVRRLDLWDAPKIRRILSDHREILAALEAHDPQAAADAIRRHLGQTVARLPALRAEHPDYFRAETPRSGDGAPRTAAPGR
ncbi:GntR family transcriptional regulator [Salipiger mucosus]|uniref:GntR family transcriptional regulator n=1 Tax=Salipiger mucosus TaxID=263378 RepID=UPI00038127C2|nr:GntR family transcriptional regulator [Salipiger mucosus]